MLYRYIILSLIVLTLQIEPVKALEFKEVLTQDAIPGWEVKTSKTETWAVEDGVLFCQGGAGDHWIGTKKHYTDFIIEFEFKLPPGGNSGLYFRAARQGRPWQTGMEAQILDDQADKYANLKPYQFCGSLYAIQAPSKSPAKPAGQWNHMRVTADHDHIVIELNGEVVVDTDGKENPEILKRNPCGPLGFQNHSSKVWYRHIRFADLAEDRMRRSQWWREAKFGMFIHWGVYSVPGKGEWIMLNDKINTPRSPGRKLPACEIA